MADPHPRPGDGDDARAAPGRRPATGIPRWAKVIGAVVIALILLVVVAMLAGGGGGHGPGRHTPPSDAATEGRMPPAGHRATEHGARQP